MTIRTVELYNSYNSEIYGTVYFNTDTRTFYADAECRSPLEKLPIPSRKQWKCLGIFDGTGTSSTKYAETTGDIVYIPTWASSGTSRLYTRWEQISVRFYFSPESTATWRPRTTEFFRSVNPSNVFYSDDQLQTELDHIETPYKSGSAYNGDKDGLDKNGRITPGSYYCTKTSTSDYAISSCKWVSCYKMTLNCGQGVGGEVDPVYYNSVQDNWTNDDKLVSHIDAVELPHYAGRAFMGYFTASSGGTQVIDWDGHFLDGAKITSNKTFYAQYALPYTITLNDNGGTGGAGSIYYGGGKFYGDSILTQRITSVQVPHKDGYRFNGYWNGSTQIVDANGQITATTASASLTATAQWERLSYAVTIQKNGGSGVSVVFANIARTGVYDEQTCSGEPLQGITPLTRSGYRYVGLFATNSTSGTKLVDDAGNFTENWAAFLAGINNDTTIYAQWQLVFTIGLNAEGGTGAPAEIYYDDGTGQFYDNAEIVTPISAIVPPVLPSFRFDGFYTASTGGTQVIDGSGNISGEWVPTQSGTVYAHWTRRSWKYAFDTDGGTTTQPAVFNDGTSGTYYADDTLTQPTTTVALPTKPGYDFGGYYRNGVEVVTASGELLLDTPIAEDTTATARWLAKTYTLTFDYNGGTGTTTSKQVTFGQPIGALPGATRNRATFSGWLINGEPVTSATVYAVPNDAVARANWLLQFGDVTDYFGLASGALIPISSDNGDNKQRLCVAHTGRYEPGVDQTSGTWRNPSVTYVVAKSTTLALTLGRAFAASGTISGYMIVAATVETRVGQFPTVTVEAVANEGANAINQFPVSIPIVARSKAQNLLNSVSGGGYLNACTIRASCEPVVIAENMMPCASDVVHGRYEMTATTIATERESAPTATNGFTSVGEPKTGNEANYTTYTLNAQKEIA